MSNSLTFYDRHGSPIAYMEDGEHIYMFSGEPVAYIFQNMVYGYNGKHLGWFENGWVRDKRGMCVLYCRHANGGPITPITHVEPVKAITRITPIKGVRNIPSIKPVPSLGWSTCSGKDFFKQ